MEVQRIRCQSNFLDFYQQNILDVEIFMVEAIDNVHWDGFTQSTRQGNRVSAGSIENRRMLRQTSEGSKRIPLTRDSF